jgi:hypothetical protein
MINHCCIWRLQQSTALIFCSHCSHRCSLRAAAPSRTPLLVFRTPIAPPLPSQLCCISQCQITQSERSPQSPQTAPSTPQTLSTNCQHSSLRLPSFPEVWWQLRPRSFCLSTLERWLRFWQPNSSFRSCYSNSALSIALTFVCK